MKRTVAGFLCSVRLLGGAVYRRLGMHEVLGMINSV